MKSTIDLLALKRELEAKIILLNTDTVFINNPGSQQKINKLRQRLETTEQIIENYDIFSWCFDNTSSLKRNDLTDQDR